MLYAYLLDQGVMYLTVTDRSFPRFVIFEYLRELASAFSLEFGTSVPLFNRPFAAVSFDTTLEQIRRRFMDPQSQGGHGMQRLNNNLAEIHDIMSRNINDIVNRGDRLSGTPPNNELSKFHVVIKQHIMSFARHWDLTFFVPCFPLFCFVSLDIENRSNQILADSRAIKKHAKYANFLSMIKAWGPAIAAVVVIMFVLYFRFK